MSSMLLRASRVAARSAVSAASRRAAGAATMPLLRSTPVVASPLSGRYLASRLAGALLRRRSHPVASPPFRRCLSSHMADSDSGHVDFPFTDKDLESDEALWALYERWCKAFGEQRSCEEMQRRFDEFKSSVLLVDSFNKKAIRNGKSGRLEVNMFADGKLAEAQSYSLPSDFFDRVPYSAFRRCLSSHMADSDEGHVDFPFTDKDLESDEALWALYERWCKAFGEERSCEEMQRRFDKFKSCVLLVDSFNKKAIKNGKSNRLEVNMFADGKLAEAQSYSLPSDFFDRVPYSGPLLNKEVSEEGFSKKGSELEDFTYPY